MTFRMMLLILLAFSAGALAPLHAATPEAAHLKAQQIDTAAEMAGPPAANSFARNYPLVAPKRNAAWTCTELVGRTHQGYSDAEVVFTAASIPNRLPPALNFRPTSCVGALRSLLAVAVIRHRGPPLVP
jgi:hypothetical protein